MALRFACWALSLLMLRTLPHCAIPLQSSNTFDQSMEIDTAFSITTETLPNLPSLLTSGGIAFTIDPCLSDLRRKYQAMITEASSGCLAGKRRNTYLLFLTTCQVKCDLVCPPAPADSCCFGGSQAHKHQ